MCVQSHAMGSRTGFRLGVLAMGVISGVLYFREIVLGSSRSVNEATPWRCTEKSLSSCRYKSGQWHVANLTLICSLN